MLIHSNASNLLTVSKRLVLPFYSHDRKELVSSGHPARSDSSFIGGLTAASDPTNGGAHIMNPPLIRLMVVGAGMRTWSSATYTAIPAKQQQPVRRGWKHKADCRFFMDGWRVDG